MFVEETSFTLKTFFSSEHKFFKQREWDLLTDSQIKVELSYYRYF